MSEQTKIVYRTPAGIKWLIAALTLCFLGSLFWIRQTSDLKNNVIMGPYLFTEVEGLVRAQGAWLSSDTELANPLQAVEINCWEQFGHCFVNYGEITEQDTSSTGFLSTFSEVFEISRWTPDVIETAPTESAAGCVETQLRLDKRSETVTFTRRTIDNKTGLCDGIDSRSFTLTLGDGLERIRQAKARD